MTSRRGLRQLLAILVLAFIVVEICDSSTPFIRVSAAASDHQSPDLPSSPTHAATAANDFVVTYMESDSSLTAFAADLEDQFTPPTRKRPPIVHA